MRHRLLAVVVLLAFVPCARGDDKPTVIGPAEAAKKVNEQVTLEMEVKSATLRGTNCFLNSEKDFRDSKNLTLFIDKDALARFKEAKIDDPAAHFKGKTVRVEGKVVLYREKPEIKLSGPDDIKIVEKK
jgi:DNA/RNA endonuclease YhcR with UshA esterase domain